VAAPPVRVLSLCAGIGGLDLGVRLAIPGARTVCYVEREAYCCALLAARMHDRSLDDAPIWTDVATFDGRAWRGAVDCVIGGYPCQPFSVAGRRAGADDPRHLWPHIARILGECEPEWCFFENVANHLNLGYRDVRRELEAMGYRVAEGLFTAAEVGAPHRRQRLFILAHHIGRGRGQWANLALAETAGRLGTREPAGSDGDVADTESHVHRGERDARSVAGASGSPEGAARHRPEHGALTAPASADVADALGVGHERTFGERDFRGRSQGAAGDSGEWVASATTTGS
jgi:DNA (cytosine-5)-methyltransferase 1